MLPLRDYGSYVKKSGDGREESVRAAGGNIAGPIDKSKSVRSRFVLSAWCAS